MEPCTLPQSMTHLDVIQAHVRRLPRTSYAGSKNLPYPLLFSGLVAAWGVGKSALIRGSQNSMGYISEAAFSLGVAHPDAM